MQPGDVSAGQAAASTSACPPRTIDEYSEHAMLHEGRHSTVWSAVDPTTHETVVIKSYLKTRMKPRHAQHVVRETRLLQLLRDARCRGVVKLRHAYEDDDCVHLVFEPCMRGDLYQLMTRQHGKLQEAFVACQVVAPLLSTLAFLHELNIVHRDVKTENIFLSSSGELQLGDFGLVAHKLHDQLLDRVGTLDYMAPEVLAMPPLEEEHSSSRASGSSMPGGSRHSSRGPGSGNAGANHPQPYDEKVDIWAVGVLLYELLVGKPPFEVEDPAETARLILLARVDSFPATMPADCIDFIQAALSRRPQDRPDAQRLMQHPWLQRHLAAAHPLPHVLLHTHSYPAAQQQQQQQSHAYAHGAHAHSHAPAHGFASPPQQAGGSVFAYATGAAAAAMSASSHSHGAAHGVHGGSRFQRDGDRQAGADQGQAPASHLGAHTSVPRPPLTQSHSQPHLQDSTTHLQYTLCDVDLPTLNQQIDDAWRIDELERVMAELEVGLPTCDDVEQPEPLDAEDSVMVGEVCVGTCDDGGGYLTSASPLGGDGVAAAAAAGAGSISAGASASASASFSAGAGTGGGASPTGPSASSCGMLPRPVCLVACIGSPKTPGPSSGRESPIQSPSSPSAWARQAREGLCKLRTSSYQVLGKDLAHSAGVCHHTMPPPTSRQWHTGDASGASGTGGRGYPLTSSLSDTFWEGAAAAAAGGSLQGGGGSLGTCAAGMVEVSSRSFTSGVTMGYGDAGGPRSADNSAGGTPAWQRAAPQKAAGRSRFAS